MWPNVANMRRKKRGYEFRNPLILWSRKGDLNPRLADYELASLFASIQKY